MNENEIEQPVAQCWLYHPSEAPKGRRFYTDNLPDDPAWVDTPSKFPGWKKDRLSPEPDATEVRVEATECFYYHREHGAVRFWTNALPSEDEGWFDNPTAAKQWDPDKKAVQVWLSPKAFDTLDEFMAAYVEANVTDDMPPTKKGQARKQGLAEYALGKHAVELDLRKPVDVLAAEVRALE